MNSRAEWIAWASELTPESIDCVAIKVVHPRHADTVDAELAVHRALEAGEKSAPQVAKLIDTFVVVDHPCLVSEMFGEELGPLLTNGSSRLPTLDALLVIFCSGCNHCTPWA